MIGVKKSQSVARQPDIGAMGDNKLNLSIEVLSSNNKQNASLMMQHHNNLDMNSLKLSKITEERMNHHSMDGANSARGKGQHYNT